MEQISYTSYQYLALRNIKLVVLFFISIPVRDNCWELRILMDITSLISRAVHLPPTSIQWHFRSQTTTDKVLTVLNKWKGWGGGGGSSDLHRKFGSEKRLCCI